jgi:hypothetical protein
MRKMSGMGPGSQGNRINSDQRATCADRLRLATPQISARLAAVDSASSHTGASSPILRPSAAAVTASEPKESQMATPTTSAVRTGETARRTLAAYVNEDYARMARI